MFNENEYFKEVSKNYLKEINPNFSIDVSNRKCIANTNINMDTNPLILIHQKYSNIERLKANGVEILKEKDSVKLDDKNNNNKYYRL